MGVADAGVTVGVEALGVKVAVGTGVDMGVGGTSVGVAVARIGVMVEVGTGAVAVGPSPPSQAARIRAKVTKARKITSLNFISYNPPKSKMQFTMTLTERQLAIWQGLCTRRSPGLLIRNPIH